MERIKNRVNLTGFVGAEPVITNFAEKRMARLSIGVHEYYKNSLGEAVDQTQWFNLIFWNDKVALLEGVVKKGVTLRVLGKLSAQTYTDKNGDQRYTTEIIVNEMEVVDRYEL